MTEFSKFNREVYFEWTEIFSAVSHNSCDTGTGLCLEKKGGGNNPISKYFLYMALSPITSSKFIA